MLPLIFCNSTIQPIKKGYTRLNSPHISLLDKNKISSYYSLAFIVSGFISVCANEIKGNAHKCGKDTDKQRPFGSFYSIGTNRH
jgi:hypothetical protein